MEKLSLEKFNSFELSENSAFKVKGGSNKSGAGSRYQHTVGSTAVSVSYSSDVNHSDGVSWSCDQTDVDTFENE